MCLFLSWHPNGQKWWEGTHKDGKEVSGQYFNNKGEEVETNAQSLK